MFFSHACSPESGDTNNDDSSCADLFFMSLFRVVRMCFVWARDRSFLGMLHDSRGPFCRTPGVMYATHGRLFSIAGQRGRVCARRRQICPHMKNRRVHAKVEGAVFFVSNRYFSCACFSRRDDTTDVHSGLRTKSSLSSVPLPPIVNTFFVDQAQD